MTWSCSIAGRGCERSDKILDEMVALSILQPYADEQPQQERPGHETRNEQGLDHVGRMMRLTGRWARS